jgi:hypothetical protein
MTRVFTVDENNDLVIGTDGKLSISADLDATMQACQQAAQAQLGEMILAVDQGVPNFETIWNGAPTTTQFEAYLRRQILAVDGVLDIVSLETSIANNVLNYTIVILTRYGEGAING